MQPSLTETISGVTMGGTFQSNRIVTLQQLKLPSLCSESTLPAHQARVFQAPCKYDMILGRDILRHFNIKLNFADLQIECKGNSTPMPSFPATFTTPAALACDLLLDLVEPRNLLDSFALGIKPDILAADYRPADIEAVVNDCTHLDKSQREKLYDVLKDFVDVFAKQEPESQEALRSTQAHRLQSVQSTYEATSTSRAIQNSAWENFREKQSGSKDNDQ